MAEQEAKRHAKSGVIGGPMRRGPRSLMLGTPQKAKDVRRTLSRLWGYVKQENIRLSAVVLLVAITTAVGVAGPYLMGVAIDGYILEHDAAGLTRIVLLMLGVYISTALTTWLQTYLMAEVAQRTVRTIRNDLFAQLQTLSLRFFDKHPHGELMSRLANDVENINHVLSEGVTRFIAGILTVTVMAAVMFGLNARLALVSMGAIPLMVSVTKWIARHTHHGFRERQRTLGILNGFIEETITGQRVVKAYGREQEAITTFEKANTALRTAAETAQIYSLVLFPLMNLVNNAGFALVAGVGGWMAIHSLATVGTIACFLSYTRQFARPLHELANLYNAIQSAIAGAERIFGTLDEVPEVSDSDDAKALDRARGEICFEEVSFRYVPEVQVLKNICLHARPGEVIALVGPTGAGKTTLVNVLTRFYDIEAGRITVDGDDIRHLRKASLRRQLGIVLQDTFLFSASVMENIRYGQLDATDEEVIAAAKLTEADHFICHLPQGYDTRLSERGSNLSQGQRQLLAITRAVLANHSILILDEATSSVDTRTEIHIQKALLRLMQGRTSFVIAHRLSTIRNADQVLVIDDGRIIERGTHDELLQQGGFYHKLYLSQFKGDTPLF